jgi:Zn-dependent M28 family amino/carboxypeptidase
VRAYIAGELRRAGIRVEEQPFVADTPDGKIPMVNLVGVIRGRRQDVILLGSHYDTKYFPHFHFVGANDSGSSTGLLLELGQVLAARPREYTYWLAFFDGEEARQEWSATDGIYGSRAMVARLRRNGRIRRIRAAIVLDMIGDRNLDIRRERSATPWLQELIWQAARDLGYGGIFLNETLGVEDDHVPFLRAGVPAVLLIDFSYGGRNGENAYWHTPEDTLDKLDARSLEIVGRVVLESLPRIEQGLGRRP